MSAMTAARVAAAVAWFVVFGALAVPMGRSAYRDWRQGRREHDAGILVLALEQWWPALIAAAMAVLVPVALAIDV
jgi:hypothetical protein